MEKLLGLIHSHSIFCTLRQNITTTLAFYEELGRGKGNEISQISSSFPMPTTLAKNKFPPSKDHCRVESAVISLWNVIFEFLNIKRGRLVTPISSLSLGLSQTDPSGTLHRRL